LLLGNPVSIHLSIHDSQTTRATAYSVLDAGVVTLAIARTNPLDNLRALENNDTILFVMKGGQVIKDMRTQ
jgi:hypothetical protein